MKRIVVQSFTGVVIAVLIAAFISFAGSQGGVQINGMPVFALCTVLALAAQWVVYVPSQIARTEHYYDLTGSLTYISVTIFALVAAGNFDLRSLLVAALCLIWAGRLGSFLFLRVKQAGSDRRFTKMMQVPMQFFMTWTLQGLWVIVTLAAGLAVLTSEPVPIGGWAIAGAIVWLIGFTLEVIADRQKTKFRSENKEGFITGGLWSWSRHPNYFGEIVLWVGIALIAVPVLSGWQWVTMISPIFVIVLLTQISGVRMLEASARKRWGDDEHYQQYVAKTSVLVPMPPST
ncbi:MAG: steroid 5-alpha reductase family enzyme [Candidatus Azotimanducaceae bacterium]